MKKFFLFLFALLLTVTPASAEKAPAGSVFLTYEELGWTPPETGAEAYERYKKTNWASMIIIGRSSGSLLVGTKKDRNQLFILKEGEKIPENDTDVVPGKLKIEPLTNGGADDEFGMIKVTTLDEKGFMILGTGMVLPVGTELAIDAVNGWYGKNIPAGVARIQPKGVLFIPKG